MNNHELAAQIRPLNDEWRISSYCVNGSCIQVRLEGEVVQVRDSTDPTGPVLNFNLAAWMASLAGIVGSAHTTEQRSVSYRR